MALYYVYKKDWDFYVEHRGVIVVSDNPNRAKGIGMKRLDCSNYPKKDIIVEEIDLVSEEVLCVSDRILNTIEYN